MVSIRTTAVAGVFGLCALAGLMLGAGAWQKAPADSKPRTALVKLDAKRTLGKPQVYRNLTLVPVYDKSARPTDSFLTLDEGLKLKQVSVKESKAGGDVNTLYVTNDSRKPLYLMGGEVVLGGQQDRTLGRDTIIPPGRKDTPVTVFCVEHGRWVGHRDFEASAPSVASAEIRARAQEGEFYAAREAASAPLAEVDAAPNAAPGIAGAHVRPGRANALSNSQSYGDVVQRTGRSGHVSDAQQKVWDKVAEKNAKLKTESKTGSYRGALTLSGGDAQKSVPAYLTALSGSLGSDSHLIGVVAAINGKVVAADMFSDPILFRKLWPKLLRSYASDAVEHTPEDGKKAPIVSASQAKDFLITATDAKSRIENKSDVSSTVRYESSQAVTYSLVPKPKPAPALGGGFSGGAVHTGVLGK